MDHSALHMNHADDHRHLVSINNNHSLDNDSQNVSDLFDLSNNISYLFTEGSAHNYTSLIQNSGIPSYTYTSASGSGGSVQEQQNLNTAINDFSARSRIEDMQKTTSTATTANDPYTTKEDVLTPLMSPAMTPSFNGGQQPDSTRMMNRDTHFSPLASPAMVPQNDATNSMQQSDQLRDYMAISPESMHEHYQRLEEAKMALEEQLWELKSKQPISQVYHNPRKRQSPSVSNVQAAHAEIAKAQQSQAMIGSYSATTKSPLPTPIQSTRMSPATPASLMKMSIPTSTSAVGGKKTRKRNSSKSTTTTTNTPLTTMPPPQTQSPSMHPIASSPGMRQIHPTPPCLKPRISSISASPRTLKPLLTSPTMSPSFGSSNPSNEEAARILAAKSNYQNLREGKTAQLGINFSPGIHSGIEIRRSAHKAAEQKRRDNLKEWFDRLRTELEDGYLDSIEHHLREEKEQQQEGTRTDDQSNKSSDDANEEQTDDAMDLEKSQDDDSGTGAGAGLSGLNKQPMSKVLLLQYSYEYIVKLKNELRERDDKINDLESAMSKR